MGTIFKLRKEFNSNEKEIIKPSNVRNDFSQ